MNALRWFHMWITFVVKILDKNKILYEDSIEQEPCCESNELKKIICFIHVPNKAK
jgi:hypothetical protein